MAAAGFSIEGFECFSRYVESWGGGGWSGRGRGLMGIIDTDGTGYLLTEDVSILITERQLSCKRS